MMEPTITTILHNNKQVLVNEYPCTPPVIGLNLRGPKGRHISYIHVGSQNTVEILNMFEYLAKLYPILDEETIYLFFKKSNCPITAYNKIIGWASVADAVIPVLINLQNKHKGL